MDTLSARGDTDILSVRGDTDTLSARGVKRDWHIVSCRSQGETDTNIFAAPQILQSVSEIQSFTYHRSVNALYEQKISVLTFFYIKGEGQMQTRA